MRKRSNSAAEERRQKKRKLDEKLSPLSSLPDEMIVSCLARVSRSDLAAMSVVSKRYRSLVTSPELYKTRSELGCVENFLYACLLTPPDPSPRWFVFRRGKPLFPIPSLPSQAPEASSVVVLDWGIYVIGGCIKGRPTSDVWLLDCRTHTWHYAPSMAVPRAAPAVGVIGGKIYVFGGCWGDKVDSLDWAEVFDPKTQTWDTLPPMPDRKMRTLHIHDSIVVREDKVYAIVGKDKTYYYSASEGQWGRATTTPPQRNPRDWCVIDKLIYCVDSKGNLCWCEPEDLDREPQGMYYWRRVKGLDSLNKKTLSTSRLVHFGARLKALWEARKIPNASNKNLIDMLPGARLSTCGGNLVLFWDVIEGDQLEIWFAEISLERRKGPEMLANILGPEMWGNIVSSHFVMTVDPFLDHYKVLHSVSVTL
ncbi:putative F-box/kelch-repeat protein [Cardamine amara subsp. amara]|uniref:F-box/kelch-repeat protein n=1 Tax=Cardamine amara subsp. amara TaxID=228776 RepID=A0ABD0ZGR6_CARAN